MRWLRSFLTRTRLEREMAEEMRLHIEARAADLVARGMKPREAERTARIEFGSMDRYQEEGRAARGWSWTEALRQDLRSAWRSLRRSPGFALIAMATLALGIGANAAVFSVIDSVLLKPLAYRDPERIHALWTVFRDDAPPDDGAPVSGVVFKHWRESCAACEHMTMLFGSAVNLNGAGTPQRVDALSTSGPLFSMLGVRMQLGRDFAPEEYKTGGNNVVVISDALWRSTFGASLDAIGRKVVWNTTPMEIVGVLPAGFSLPRGDEIGPLMRFPERFDLFRPMNADTSVAGEPFNYSALVKLRPGATLAQAAAEMNRAALPTDPYLARARVRLQPLRDRMVAGVREPLWMLSAGAIVLLAIACVNLGNLLLVRASSRQREWAIRAAIGAGRGTLVRQALTEALALAALGGALGTTAAAGLLRLLPMLAWSSLPRIDEIAMDWRVAAITLAVSALAGAVCSVAPVWRILRADPQQTLGSARQGSETKGDRRARHALVLTETALSVALAAAAGLLLVSFARVMAIERGFETEQAVTFQLSLEGHFPPPQRNAFHEELLAKLRAIPGVEAAGLTSWLPLDGVSWISRLSRRREEHESSDPTAGLMANFRWVSPGYLEAAGTLARFGRTFADADRDQRVVILSETAARKAFGAVNAVGQTIYYNNDGGPPVLEVIGIVPDVRTEDMETEPPPMVYLPMWRQRLGSTSYAVRSRGEPAGVVAAIRKAAAIHSPTIPIFRVRTFEEMVSASVAARRLRTLLVASFAGAGVLLTCLGVFGVVSYSVARRTREIGVRMALGATRGSVVTRIVRESLGPVLGGAVLGSAIALAMGRLLESQLYGVGGSDPAVLGTVAALICVAAVCAALRPALRASEIEPVRALHCE